MINRKEIEAQGARTVKEALRFVPGILPDGTVGTEIGGLSGQFIRGSNTGQVLILLNGRPVNNLGGGGFDLSEITTDIVERVEVLPGGGSTLYGSDAIGGTINIITLNSLINGSVTSPAIGARWNLGETTTLRGNYIRNFRVPTLFNLFSNSPFAQGNPDLKPERGNSFDIGIDQQLGDIGLLRFTFFNNTITDNIAYDNVNFTYENIGKVRTTGVELALNLQLAKNFYFSGNYTANDPRILESSTPAEVDQELRFAGADSINLGLSYENPQGWYAGVLMHSLGSYPTNNTNTESLPGYTTFDFKLRVPVSENLALNGSIENILDRRFQLFPGFPDAGRIVQAGVNYKF